MEKDMEDSGREYSPDSVINICRQKNITHIAFTYNEPTTWFEYNYDISVLAKKNDIYTIYVTNGSMSINVREKLSSVIDAFNIDLKSFNSGTYKKIMSGDLDVVKSNIEYFFKMNKLIEVTTLLVPDMNDSSSEID